MTIQTIEEIQQINEVNSRIVSLYCAYTKQKGIHYNEFLMYYILLEGKKTQKELSQRTHLIKQTVNNIIQAMKQEGYVDFQEVPHNNKQKYVVLTILGETKAHEIIDSVLEIEKRCVDKMGKENLEQLIRLSNQFANTLKEEMK